MSNTPENAIKELREVLRRTSVDLNVEMRETLDTMRFRVHWMGDDGKPVPAIGIRLEDIDPAAPDPTAEEAAAVALTGVLSQLDAAATHGEHSVVPVNPSKVDLYQITDRTLKAFGEAIQTYKQGRPEADDVGRLCGLAANRLKHHIVQSLPYDLQPAQCEGMGAAEYVEALQSHAMGEATASMGVDVPAGTRDAFLRVVGEMLGQSFDDLTDIASRGDRVVDLVGRQTTLPASRRRMKAG